jgi:transcriptional antiterminator NusG
MAHNAKWYVVHTYSGYEKKVAATIEKAVENRKLSDLVLAVSVPTETVTAISKDKTKTFEQKLFPGYVLVHMVMTDESWHVVRNTRGVTGFVGPGSKPVPLTDSEVSALGVEKHEITVNYSAGDNVKIVDGPFEGFIGLCDRIDTDKQRVHVVVAMFGRETPVELGLDQVEPLVG